MARCPRLMTDPSTIVEEYVTLISLGTRQEVFGKTTSWVPAACVAVWYFVAGCAATAWTKRW